MLKGRPIPRPYLCYLKRAFDLIVIVLAFAVLAPVSAVVALLVRLNLGSPILFHQVRPGKHGVPFVMHKFRSMAPSHDIDALDSLEERLSPFGRWLRATSLDELPEVCNVLCGEMSFVGPRPLLMRYLPRYSAEQARRHDVLPGITGWAQVNGRNDLSWKEKFQLDVWYVDNVSFVLDLKILLLTVIRTLRREGISKNGCFSSPEFTGSDEGMS